LVFLFALCILIKKEVLIVSFKCAHQEKCRGFEQGDLEGLPCKHMRITPDEQLEFSLVKPVCHGEKKGRTVERLFAEEKAA
jgi:hypothetical protein